MTPVKVIFDRGSTTEEARVIIHVRNLAGKNYIYFYNTMIKLQLYLTFDL